MPLVHAQEGEAEAAWEEEREILERAEELHAREGEVEAEPLRGEAAPLCAREGQKLPCKDW